MTPRFISAFELLPKLRQLICEADDHLLLNADLHGPPYVFATPPWELSDTTGN